MFKKISQNLFNKPDEIGLDNYLVLVICFNISVIGFLGTLINIFLQLGWVLVISTLIPGIAFAGIYFFSRHQKKYLVSKYLLVILSILIINIEWILNFGTYGPILYLFVVIECFILILFKKWESIFFTGLVVINVTVLFLVEYTYPNLIGKYADDYSRLIDLYWGMLIYLALSILMINIALNFYIKEKVKAEEADKLKTSFLANMSHEIRTPMNAIIGFGELLYRTNIEEKQKLYLDVINTNSHHLLKLIEDIIDIAKIESNQLTMIIEDFSVNDLFEEVEHVILQFLKKHNKQHIQLICNKPTESFLVRSDYTRIKQVLTNLLSNATKFTEQGSIVYGCTTDSDGITFYVQDTGIGIEAEHLDEIFQRFRKIDNKENENVYKGTGLGLSISKQIIEMLNGKIWVESEPGTGSKFLFTIQTKIIYIDMMDNIGEKKAINFNFSDEMVLIVEDEDDNYNFLFELLDRHNIKVIRANNGNEAIDLCKIVEGISLILMDIKMPKMDGETAAKLIKKSNAKIHIIAQTAYAMGNDKEYFLKNGFDGYISKPIKPNSLFAIIDKHIIRK